MRTFNANMVVVAFNRLRVSNLDARATATELSELFGLRATPYLVKNTSVEIKSPEDDDRYAVMILPQEIAVEVLKLNGIVYYEKSLSIKDEDDDDTLTTAADASNTVQETENTILFMLLDLRNHPHLQFPEVTEVEVCDALLIEFADDPHKAIKKGWGRTLGTFRIESTDMEKYVDKNLTIRGVPIPLGPIYPAAQDTQSHSGQRAAQRTFNRDNRDPDGIKIRIFDAFTLQNRNIDNSRFDEHFESMGVEIIKQTQPERCRERREIFNTNRFIVVKKVNEQGIKVDFGERITVHGQSFRLSYYDMKSWCAQCKMKHGRPCPAAIHFDFLRTLRKRKTDSCKVYSDSTMRNVNQLALSTNVACTTGAGIGQLCNVIPLDKHHEEVVINGGTNELKSNLKEFVYTISKTEEKLRALAENVAITVVLPPIVEDVPEMTVKSKYLHDSMTRIESINVIKLENIENDQTMHRHPTEKGTADLVAQIHAQKPIILPNCESDVAQHLKYRHVQTLFKAGCRACGDLTYTTSLCAKCKTEAAHTEVSELREEIRKVTEKLYPMLPTENLVEMKETNATKRSRSTITTVIDDDDGKSSKSPRGGDA